MCVCLLEVGDCVCVCVISHPHVGIVVHVVNACLNRNQFHICVALHMNIHELFFSCFFLLTEMYSI